MTLARSEPAEHVVDRQPGAVSAGDVQQRTAGLIDRTIDGWEADCGSSTLNNTVAALVRVLDEAVRDGLIPTNPSRSRSRRAWNKVPGRAASPRSQALADLPTLIRLSRR